MELFTKQGLADDTDWSSPAQVEPPAGRQHGLRETSALTVVCRTGAGVEVVGTCSVNVLMKVPGRSPGQRASWQSIGLWPAAGESPPATSLPLKLDVGNNVVIAVRLYNIVAPGAATVDVDVMPWRAA